MFSERLNISSAGPGGLTPEMLADLVEQLGLMPSIPSNAMQPTAPMPGMPSGAMQPTVDTPVWPAIGIRGRTFGKDPLFDFGPHGSERGRLSGMEASGRLGLDALLNGYRFGGGVRGNWHKGRLDFPGMAQEFGTPSNVEWGSRGVELQGLDAYLQNPAGTRISVGGNPDPENRSFSIYFNKKF